MTSLKKPRIIQIAEESDKIAGRLYEKQHYDEVKIR